MFVQQKFPSCLRSPHCSRMYFQSAFPYFYVNLRLSVLPRETTRSPVRTPQPDTAFWQLLHGIRGDDPDHIFQPRGGPPNPPNGPRRQSGILAAGPSIQKCAIQLWRPTTHSSRSPSSWTGEYYVLITKKQITVYFSKFWCSVINWSKSQLQPNILQELFFQRWFFADFRSRIKWYDKQRFVFTTN